MCREADLSAKSPGAQTPPRVSLTHGDGGRAPGGGRASGPWPAAPVGLNHDAGEPPVPAVVRLRRRSQFLAAARGVKEGRPAFLLQMKARPAGEIDDAIGVGITVTRKIGGAVVRNRVRRRLRAALGSVLPGAALPGHNYVVVARPRAIEHPFAELVRDLASAIAALGLRQAGGRRQAGMMR